MDDLIQPPKSLPPGSVVWAYLRDSGGEEQDRSISQQKENIEAFCRQYGLVLERIFQDAARSGRSLAGREAFFEMIELSEQPGQRPKGLLVWSYSRFSRDLDDSNYYKSMLRKRGLVIHSLTDQTPEGPYGRVVETIYDVVNQEQVRKQAIDIRRGLKATCQEGYSAGGRPPKGFKTEKVYLENSRSGKARVVSRWVPDDELWEDVKLAWRMRAEGRSYLEITKATGGKLFTISNSWAAFFKNKTYLGIGKCGGLEIPNHHPAAIDQETFDKVQKVLEGSPKFGKAGHPAHPRRQFSPSLLSGLAVCIHCGAAIIRQTSNNQRGYPWAYYVCGKKVRARYKDCEGRQINARLADQAVFDATLRVMTAEYLDNLLAEMRSKFEEDQEEENLRKQLISLDRKIRNLVELVEDFGAKAGVDRLRELEGERGRVVLDLEQIEARRKAARLEVTTDMLEAVISYWRLELLVLRDKNDLKALRGFMQRFIEKVELGYNKARIWYRFPLDDLYTLLEENSSRSINLLGCQAVMVEWE